MIQMRLPLQLGSHIEEDIWRRVTTNFTKHKESRMLTLGEAKQGIMKPCILSLQFSVSLKFVQNKKLKSQHTKTYGM